jgi:hypothetical protein
VSIGLFERRGLFYGWECGWTAYGLKDRPRMGRGEMVQAVLHMNQIMNGKGGFFNFAPGLALGGFPLCG